MCIIVQRNVFPNVDMVGCFSILGLLEVFAYYTLAVCTRHWCDTAGHSTDALHMAVSADAVRVCWGGPSVATAPHAKPGLPWRRTVVPMAAQQERHNRAVQRRGHPPPRHG